MSPPPLRVRVPGSTSNLGPGFDCLGVALSLFVEVELRGSSETHAWVETTGEAASWPREDNLVWRGFDLARGDARGEGFAFAARSEVPMARGLGSSGAALAAGLLLGEAVARAEGAPARSRAELFELGLPIEGHPDNLAPALLGGARLSVPLPDRAPRVLHPAVHPSIGWSVAWPDVRTPTEEARAVLPASVPFQAAVENPRRLALLLEGLATGEPDLLAEGVVDHLHAVHRLALVKGSRTVLDVAREAGAWAATLNGSGSSLLALGPKEGAADVAAAMAEAWIQATGAGHGAAVEFVPEAPRILTPR